jgi:hypothetical protein
MLCFGKGFILGVGVALFIASAANAKTYRFRVNCADETYVAQWEADSPDLDKDYFRIATGDTNLDCSGTDGAGCWFNHSTMQASSVRCLNC